MYEGDKIGNTEVCVVKVKPNDEFVGNFYLKIFSERMEEDY